MISGHETLNPDETPTLARLRAGTGVKDQFDTLMK